MPLRKGAGAVGSKDFATDDLGAVLTRLEMARRNRYALSRARQDLLIERSKFRSGALVLRTLLQAWGAFISMWKVVRERDAPGSIEEDYLMAERSLGGSMWTFMEKETVFYQYELQDIFADEDRDRHHNRLHLFFYRQIPLCLEERHQHLLFLPFSNTPDLGDSKRIPPGGPVGAFSALHSSKSLTGHCTGKKHDSGESISPDCKDIRFSRQGILTSAGVRKVSSSNNNSISGLMLLGKTSCTNSVTPIICWPKLFLRRTSRMTTLCSVPLS
jgi:hypothetical protein